MSDKRIWGLDHWNRLMHRYAVPPKPTFWELLKLRINGVAPRNAPLHVRYWQFHEPLEKLVAEERAQVEAGLDKTWTKERRWSWEHWKRLTAGLPIPPQPSFWERWMFRLLKTAPTESIRYWCLYEV